VGVVASEKLSLHMIVRNAEHKLGRTLDSVKSFVDEMVIVDTGSTDGTKALAESYGAKVYDFEWIDDFSAARNFALSKTTHEWVTWFDAGDVISPESIKRFEETKAQLDAAVATYILGTLNRYYDEYGNVRIQHLTPRFVKKSAGPFWSIPIHEALLTTEKPFVYVDKELVVDDPEGQLPSATDRNLRIIDSYIAKGNDVHYYLQMRCRELEILGRYEEAVEGADKIHTLPLDADRFGEYFLVIGRCFMKMGNHEKAREMLLKSISYSSVIRDGFILLGDLEMEAEQWHRAIPYYHAALGVPNHLYLWVRNIPYFSYEPFEKLGICHLKIGDVDNAVPYLKAAINEAPDHVIKRIHALVETTQ